MIKQKNFKKIFFVAILISCVLIASMSHIKEASANVPSVSTAISSALSYLHSVQKSDGRIVGVEFTEWAVMAIAAAGQNPNTFTTNGSPSLISYLIANKPAVDTSNPLTTGPISLFVLAMTAANQNPRSISGTDYVAALINTARNGVICGDESYLNYNWWGVMALMSAGESAGSTTVSNSVAYIVSHQNSNGGWSYGIGGSSDCDDTAAAIMGLRSAGVSADSPVIKSAVQYLKSQQHSDGGFGMSMAPGAVSNTASDAWVMGAIASVGQHPAQWPVIGTNIVNNILSFQDSTGFFYWYAGHSSNPEYMTAYALQALAYAPYPVNIHYTVQLAGDFTNDGKINYLDIQQFVDAYIAYYSSQTWNHAADFNGDGKVNYLDIQALVTYYIGYYTLPS
jgi:hypothetical protein